jgi:S-ribosylhomocysteine lyase LuxS involved in autoinducer biosynthesis
MEAFNPETGEIFTVQIRKNSKPSIARVASFRHTVEVPGWANCFCGSMHRIILNTATEQLKGGFQQCEVTEDHHDSGSWLLF